MCPLLNEEQEKLFSFIMRYSQELQLNKINYLRDPNPYPIFFGGGVGARITKFIPEYMKKTLKSRGQNMNEHPAVVVTASTCKAAINVNEFSHSVVGLLVTEDIIFTYSHYCYQIFISG